MSNKNPFELRFDVLQMAKDYMDRSWEMNYMFTQQLFEQNKATAEEMKKALDSYPVEELMKKAQELYKFVTKQD